MKDITFNSFEWIKDTFIHHDFLSKKNSPIQNYSLTILDDVFANSLFEKFFTNSYLDLFENNLNQFPELEFLMSAMPQMDVEISKSNYDKNLLLDNELSEKQNSDDTAFQKINPFVFSVPFYVERIKKIFKSKPTDITISDGSLPFLLDTHDEYSEHSGKHDDVLTLFRTVPLRLLSTNMLEIFKSKPTDITISDGSLPFLLDTHDEYSEHSGKHDDVLTLFRTVPLRLLSTEYLNVLTGLSAKNRNPEFSELLDGDKSRLDSTLPKIDPFSFLTLSSDLDPVSLRGSDMIDDSSLHTSSSKLVDDDEDSLLKTTKISSLFQRTYPNTQSLFSSYYDDLTLENSFSDPEKTSPVENILTSLDFPKPYHDKHVGALQENTRMFEKGVEETISNPDEYVNNPNMGFPKQEKNLDTESKYQTEFIDTNHYFYDNLITIDPTPITNLLPMVQSIDGVVHVHTGELANKINQSLSSDAMTLGNDIFFTDEKFDLASQTGLALFAHELTHVYQQENLKNPEQNLDSKQTIFETEAIQTEQSALSFLTQNEIAVPSFQFAQSFLRTPIGSGVMPKTEIDSFQNNSNIHRHISYASEIDFFNPNQGKNTINEISLSQDFANTTPDMFFNVSSSKTKNDSNTSSMFNTSINSQPTMAMTAKSDRPINETPAPQKPSAEIIQPAIDVDQIADHVYNVIIQRIEQDRDRKGYW